MLTIALVVGLAAPPAAALDLPQPPPGAAGEVRFTTSSGRYHHPGIGPFRFVGTFRVDGKAFTGVVHGGTGTFNTSTVAWDDIALWSDDGRVAGSCTAIYHGTDLVAGAVRTMHCELSVDGAAVTDLELTIAEVGHTTTGEGTYGIEYTTHDGVFVGR